MQPPHPADDWTPREAPEAATSAFAPVDRRDRPDRRRRVWWSVVYGSFRPRRRQPSRRTDEARFHALDWHSSHLLAVALGILILCVSDAFLTVTLMAGGAIEANPVMALFIGSNVALFAGMKMAVTGLGVLMLVFLARYRFMRRVRVDVILYSVLIAYLILIAYEIGMLQQLENPNFF